MSVGNLRQKVKHNAFWISDNEGKGVTVERENTE